MTDRQYAQQVMLVVAVALVTLASASYAFPGGHTLLRNENFMRRRSLQECSRSPGLRNMCEQCAKDSRSDDAFIMCCGNETGIRDWCMKFLSFGRDELFSLHKRRAV